MHTPVIRRYDQPTKILVCDDYLPEPLYTRLCASYNAILDRGLSETMTTAVFARQSQVFYDAYGYDLVQDHDFNVEEFWTQDYYAWLKDEFSIPLLPDLSVGFHYHKAGSHCGRIHNDFSTEFNLRRKLPNELFGICNVHGLEKADYMARVRQGEIIFETRAVGMLYYLNNPEWNEGDGGETGFFSSDHNGELLLKTAPLNNRMVLFEVSPQSFHAFLRNTKRIRCSLTAFCYAKTEYMRQKYGQEPERIGALFHGAGKVRPRPTLIPKSCELDPTELAEEPGFLRIL